MKVGELFVTLGIRRDGSWTQASGWLGGIKGAALGLAGYFGMQGLGKAMFGFNATLENARIRMAGVMAIARKTDLKDQYADASSFIDQLRKTALKLPGETEDYIDAAQKMTLPILKAKGTLQDVHDLTVATYQFSRLANTDQATAARGINRALSGQVNIRDDAVRKMVEAGGMEFKAFRDLAKQNQALALQALLRGANSKQARQLREEEGKTFSGQTEQLKDRARNFLARVGESLFKNLTGSMQSANDWLDNNQAKVDEVADKIGKAIVTAFEAIKSVVMWLIEHGDLVIGIFKDIAIIIGGAMLVNTTKLMAKWGPLFLLVDGARRVFEFLKEHMSTLGAAITTAFAVGAVLLLTKKIKEMFGIRPPSSWANMFGGGGGRGGAGFFDGRGSRGRRGKLDAFGKQLPLIGAAIEADTLSREEFGGGLGMGGTERMFGEMKSGAAKQLAGFEAMHRAELITRAQRASMGAGATGIEDRDNVKFGSSAFADAFVNSGRIGSLFKSEGAGGRMDTFAEQFATLQVYTQALKDQLGDKSNEPKKVTTNYNNNTVTIEVKSAAEAADAYDEVLERNNRHAIDSVGGD